MAEDIPNSPRYEAWLDQAAATFSNPEWAKREIANFISGLRKQDVASDQFNKFYTEAESSSHASPQD